MEKIIVKNVSKTFQINTSLNTSFLSALLSVPSKKFNKKIEILKNITFTVNSGEVIGVIGENGCGKSSLLRIIAGIYRPDKGLVVTRGKVISIINLYAGLQERLTLKQNVYLICSFFGLSNAKIKKRFSTIVKFADLDDFVGTKIYKFSEGMKQRLAFSIAINCNPDILLLDEVFEVGDEEFRYKSSGKIKELIEIGASVIVVSHNFEIVKKYCNKAIFLNNGIIAAIGEPRFVIREYLNSMKK